MYNFLISVFYFEDSHSHSLKEVGKEMAFKMAPEMQLAQYVQRSESCRP